MGKVNKKQESKPSAAAKKFVALFDMHIGWEWQLIGGKRVERPTHNAAAIKATLDFVQDFVPDVVILGGDQINCGPVSRWNKGKPRLVEGFRLKDELDAFGDLVLSRVDEIKTKIWMDGNHEAWVHLLVDETPGVEGMIEPAEYLRLRDCGWQLRSQGEMYNLGKLYFVHGDVVLQSRQYRNPAQTLVAAYNRNIRAGHVHTYASYTQVTPIDRQDYHTGVIVPALSARAPYYTKFNPSNFMNGFLYGYVWPDGGFTDYVVVINKNVFTVNGKKYGGKV